MGPFLLIPIWIAAVIATLLLGRSSSRKIRQYWGIDSPTQADADRRIAIAYNEATLQLTHLSSRKQAGYMSGRITVSGYDTVAAIRAVYPQTVVLFVESDLWRDSLYIAVYF